MIFCSQMSSVIHANQQSVIQTASPTIQTPVLSKGNVILVHNKLGSVIQAPHGNLQPLQVSTRFNHFDTNDRYFDVSRVMEYFVLAVGRFEKRYG